MKKVFDEEVSLNELKDMVKKMKCRYEQKKLWFILFASAVIVGAVGLIVYKLIAAKHCKCSCGDDDDFDYDDDDDDNDEFDENGCCYTDEEDFEN